MPAQQQSNRHSCTELVDRAAAEPACGDRCHGVLVCRLRLAAGKLRRGFRASPVKCLRLLAAALGLTGYVVHSYTLVHPFLLADNRCAMWDLK